MPKHVPKREVSMAKRVPKRMREFGKPHVLCQIAWGGAEATELRWGDSVGYVPLKKMLKDATLAPAVHKAMAAHEGTNDMWKLRFSTKEAGFPLKEDSRTLLNVQIEDDAILDAMTALASSTGAQFYGRIVGHINVQTDM